MKINEPFDNKYYLILFTRNAYFQSPCNIGSELESALDESLEEEEEVGDDVLGSAVRDRSRKHTMFDRAGGTRFLESRHPFRHSYIDVRVQVWS